MPQRTFHNENKESSHMGTVLKTVLFIGVAVASFGLGWFTSNQGYRVVGSDGASVVKSNAAQVVKDENARLSREVIKKTEAEAKELLAKNNRTFFVGIRDGVPQVYQGEKVFTNLTVEVKDGKVVKILGWY